MEVWVYEPTREYQNTQKRRGVEKLTPARALIAEAVRRYSIQGLDCSILEVQKLAWFLENSLHDLGLANPDPLDLRFTANRYGPYAHRLTHLLDGLDGSYLHCEKRLADADPLDLIEFNWDKRSQVMTFLASGEGKPYASPLKWTENLIEGFQSPYGLELLATVDWLLRVEDCPATVEGIRAGMKHWPGGHDAGERKLQLFDNRVIDLALERLMRAPRNSVLANA